MSNRFTRETIDKGILKLLCYHAVNIPTILVLNKVDLLSDKKRLFYRLIEKLTCGYLDGQKQVQHSKKPYEKPSTVNTIDRYLKRKLKVSKYQHETVIKKISVVYFSKNYKQ